MGLLETKITDEGLQHVRGLAKLRWLSLSGASNVTNRGLVHLKNLKNLDDLNLEVTNTTAEEMVYLQELTRLRRLRLANDPLRDVNKPLGFKYLAKTTELRRLDARGFCNRG